MKYAPYHRKAFVVTKADGDADKFLTGPFGQGWTLDFAKARLFTRKSDAVQAAPHATVREVAVTLA